MSRLPREIRTERLWLRRWRDADREAFAALNADPQVMEHFPGLLSRVQSDALADSIEEHFDRHGFGLWAVEIPGVSEFAGYVGLSVPRFETRFTPCVEIGWRLAREYWGRGYATEGARGALAFGFERAGLDEIVSFTVPGNGRSRRVMEKIGMTRNPADDFDHPGLPEGHPLQRHVLYRIPVPWASTKTETGSFAGVREKSYNSSTSTRRPIDGFPMHVCREDDGGHFRSAMSGIHVNRNQFTCAQ